MSWYNSSWRHREAVAVNVTGGGGGSPTTEDITIALPAGWDHMWNNTRSDGYDLIAVDADGRTLLSFDILTWNQTNRTGTVRIDGYSCPDDDASCNVFLYYGNPDQAADLAAAVTIASAKTGTITLQRRKGIVIKAGLEEFAAKVPRHKIVKPAGDTVDIWWDLSQLMQTRKHPHQGSILQAELDYVTLQVLLAAVDQTAMYDETETKFKSLHAVRTRIKAGSSGTDYVISLTAGLTTGEIRNVRAFLRVLTTDESP